MDDATNVIVLTVVVLGRLLLPLLIFRYPLPAILACLVLDGYDQTIFQHFTTLELDGYQSYDKALDIFYLSMAYLATMRNWTSDAAFRVSRFLFYYRLVGVALFEAVPGDDRWLLLIFANTFEYFFIAYEIVRLYWNPARFGMRFWVWTAGLIWVVIKLPQEYWLHIAQLDMSDTLRDYVWARWILVGGIATLLVVLWFVVRPRLDPHDHPLRIEADPLDPAIGGPDVVRAARLAVPRVLTRWVAEQVVMLSLLCAIFASMLPGVDATFLQVTLWVVIIVVVNSAVVLWIARRGVRYTSIGTAFAVLVAFNLGFVWVAELLLPLRGQFPAGEALFFVLLLTLVVVLYDRYRPVQEARSRLDPAPAA